MQDSYLSLFHNIQDMDDTKREKVGLKFIELVPYLPYPIRQSFNLDKFGKMENLVIQPLVGR